MVGWIWWEDHGIIWTDTRILQSSKPPKLLLMEGYTWLYNSVNQQYGPLIKQNWFYSGFILCSQCSSWIVMMFTKKKSSADAWGSCCINYEPSNRHNVDSNASSFSLFAVFLSLYYSFSPFLSHTPDTHLYTSIIIAFLFNLTLVKHTAMLHL